MNRIDEDRLCLALDFFGENPGCSVREIAKRAGIARETASRIQKWQRIIDICEDGFTTGTKHLQG